MRYSFIILVLWSLVSASQAQQQNFKLKSNLDRFAIINIQKVLRLTLATRAIKPQLNKIRAQMQKKVQEREKALKAENLSLQEQRAILSPEAFRQRRLDFQAKVAALETDVRSFRKRLDAAGRAAMGQVKRSFSSVAADLAAERKFQLILPRAAAIYVDPAFDITDEVLKRLNKKLPTVKVVLPSKQGSRPVQ
jgi:Skp family chaperone for outer membrane proteins